MILYATLKLELPPAAANARGSPSITPRHDMLVMKLVVIISQSGIFVLSFHITFPGIFMFAYPESSLYWSHVRFSDKCFVNAPETFTPSDDSYDVMSRFSYPDIFVEFTRKCKDANGVFRMGELEDEDCLPIDTFHRNALQLLSVFGLFPLTHDNIRDGYLMSHRWIMEKKLGIPLVDNPDEFTFHNCEDLTKQRRNQAAIFLFNANQTVPFIWTWESGEPADMMRAPIILVYSKDKAHMFEAKDFKFFTRQIENKMVENFTGATVPLIEYVIDEGRWRPEVQEQNVLKLLGQLTEDDEHKNNVRADGLVVDFKKVMAIRNKSLIGYLGDVVDLAGLVFNREKTKDLIQQLGQTCVNPAVIYHEIDSCQACLFFFVPTDYYKDTLFTGGHKTNNYRHLHAPTRDTFFDCAVHAFRFMQKVCSRVENIVSLLDSSDNKPKPKDVMEQTLALAGEGIEYRYFGSGECACVAKITPSEPKKVFDSLASLLAWSQSTQAKFVLGSTEKMRFHRRTKEKMSFEVSGEVFAYVRAVLGSISTTKTASVTVRRLVAYEDGSIRIRLAGTKEKSNLSQEARVEFFSISQLDVGSLDYYYLRHIAAVTIPSGDAYQIVNTWTVEQGILVLRWQRGGLLSLSLIPNNFHNTTLPEPFYVAQEDITESDVVQANYNTFNNIVLVTIVRNEKDKCVILSCRLNEQLTKVIQQNKRSLYGTFAPLGRFPPIQGSQKENRKHRDRQKQRGKYSDIQFGGAVLNERGTDGVMIFNKVKSIGEFWDENDLAFYVVRFEPIGLEVYPYFEERKYSPGELKSINEKKMAPFKYGSCEQTSGNEESSQSGVWHSNHFPLHYSDRRLHIGCLESSVNMGKFYINYETVEIPVTGYELQRGAIIRKCGLAKQFGEMWGVVKWTDLCCSFPKEGLLKFVRSDKYGNVVLKVTAQADVKRFANEEISKVFLQAIESYGLAEAMKESTPLGKYAPIELRSLCLRSINQDEFDNNVTRIVAALAKGTPVGVSFSLVEPGEPADCDMFTLFVQLFCFPRVVVTRPIASMRKDDTHDMCPETFTQRCKEFPAFPFLRMTARMKSFVVAGIGEDVGPLLSHLLGVQFPRLPSGTLAIGSNPIPCIKSYDFETLIVKETSIGDNLVNAVGALFTIEQGKFSHAVAFLLSIAACDTVILRIKGGREEVKTFFSMVIACIDMFYFQHDIKLSLDRVLVIVVCDLGDDEHLGEQMMEEDLSVIFRQSSTKHYSSQMAKICHFIFMPPCPDTLALASIVERETLFLSKLMTEQSKLRNTDAVLAEMMKMSAIFGNQIDFEAISSDNGAFDEGRLDFQVDDLEQLVAIAEKYQKGIGVKVNTEKAIEYFRRAAQAGNPKAQLILGTEFPDTIPERESQKWLELASAVEPAAAYQRYLKTADVTFLNSAADDGYVPAMETLANLCKESDDWNGWAHYVAEVLNAKDVSWALASGRGKVSWDKISSEYLQELGVAFALATPPKNDQAKVMDCAIRCFESICAADKSGRDLYDVVSEIKDLDEWVFSPSRQNFPNDLLMLYETNRRIDKDCDSFSTNGKSLELMFIGAVMKPANNAPVTKFVGPQSPNFDRIATYVLVKAWGQLIGKGCEPMLQSIAQTLAKRMSLTNPVLRMEKGAGQSYAMLGQFYKDGSYGLEQNMAMAFDYYFVALQKYELPDDLKTAANEGLRQIIEGHGNEIAPAKRYALAKELLRSTGRNTGFDSNPDRAKRILQGCESDDVKTEVKRLYLLAKYENLLGRDLKLYDAVIQYCERPENSARDRDTCQAFSLKAQWNRDIWQETSSLEAIAEIRSESKKVQTVVAKAQLFQALKSLSSHGYEKAETMLNRLLSTDTKYRDEARLLQGLRLAAAGDIAGAKEMWSSFVTIKTYNTLFESTLAKHQWRRAPAGLIEKQFHREILQFFQYRIHGQSDDTDANEAQDYLIDHIREEDPDYAAFLRGFAPKRG